MAARVALACGAFGWVVCWLLYAAITYPSYDPKTGLYHGGFDPDPLSPRDVVARIDSVKGITAPVLLVLCLHAVVIGLHERAAWARGLACVMGVGYLGLGAWLVVEWMRHRGSMALVVYAIICGTIGLWPVLAARRSW